MSSGRLIAKNAFYLMIGELISKSSTLLLFIYLARKCSLIDFGKFNLAQNIVLLFTAFSDMGLNLYLFREIPRQKNKANLFVGSIFILKLVLSGAFYGMVLIYCEFMGYSSQIKSLTMLFCWWMIFTNIAYVFRITYKAFENMKYDMVVNMLDNFLRLILVISFVEFGKGINSLGYAYILAAFLALVSAIIIYYKYFYKGEGFQYDKNIFTSAAKEMWSLALVTLLVPLFGRIDAIVLERIKGLSDVGIYSASSKLVWMMLMFPIFITQAAFPKLSQYALENLSKFSQIIANLLKITFIVSLILCTVIVALAPIIIRVLYGVNFLSSTIILQILIWCLLLYALNSIFIYGLNAQRLQITNFKFIVLTLVLNILLDTLLGIKLGPLGVAIGTSLSLFVMLVAYFLFFLSTQRLLLEDLRFKYSDVVYFKHIFLRNREVS